MATIVDARTGVTLSALLGGLLDAGATDAVSPNSARDRLAAVAAALGGAVEIDRHADPAGVAVDVRRSGTDEGSTDTARTLGDALDTLDDCGRVDAVDDVRSVLRLGAAARRHDAVGTGNVERALADVRLPALGTDRGLAGVVCVTELVETLDAPLLATPVAVECPPDRFVLALAERAEWAVRETDLSTGETDPVAVAALAGLAGGADRLPTLDLRATGHGTRVDADGAPLCVLRGERVTTDTCEPGSTVSGSGTEPRAEAETHAGGVAGDGGHAELSVLETAVDDASPEVLGTLHETLPDAGAVDVTVLPLTGRRSRPGHLIRAVAPPAEAGRVARRLARETGTLGVREFDAVHRYRPRRTVETVTLTVGDETYDVGVKVATDGGSVIDVSAELEDALTVAHETGEPVRAVLRRAETTCRERRRDEDGAAGSED